MMIRPKNVYVVFDIDRKWIAGCFYDSDAAHSYTGGLEQLKVQELPVETRGVKTGFFERMINLLIK